MKEECGVLVFLVSVVIVVVILISTAMALFVSFPQHEHAFNTQVQGLITEYCTAPRAEDAQGARQQLMHVIEGDPDSMNRLPGALHSRAQAVYSNERESACQ